MPLSEAVHPNHRLWFVVRKMPYLGKMLHRSSAPFVQSAAGCKRSAAVKTISATPTKRRR